MAVKKLTNQRTMGVYMDIRYAIRSKKNGKYLSMLFEDKHEKAFTANNAERFKCYFWVVKDVAESVAKQMNGEVVTLNGYTIID